MKKFLFFLTTILFAIVFYEKNLGVNIALFNVACIVGLLLLKRINLPTTLSKIVFASVITSATFVVYHNTIPAFILHFLNWIIFIGVLNFKHAKAITTWLHIGIANTIMGIALSIKSIFNKKHTSTSKSKRKLKLSLYLIPIGIILLFLFIYRIANPVFDNFMVNVTDVLFKPFDYLNFEYIPIIILGLLITSP